MNGHNEWIKRGFDEGVFVLTGSLRPSMGGAIIAHQVALAAHGVVTAEILEIAPSRADARLNFLLT